MAPSSLVVSNRKTEFCCELLQLVGSQGLREDVDRLQMRVDVMQVDISSQDTFSDEVIMHINVFSPIMEIWVTGQVNVAHVVPNT